MAFGGTSACDGKLGLELGIRLGLVLGLGLASGFGLGSGSGSGLGSGLGFWVVLARQLEVFDAVEDDDLVVGLCLA